MSRSSGPTFDLSSRRELDWLAQLLADLRTAAPGLELLLVGALARDLLLHYGYAFKIERATRDADFALAVADWSEFSAARDALLAHGLFMPYQDTAHKLQHARFGWIDLIPFGAVERADGTIAWPPTGDQVMAVIGYAEAAAASLEVALPMAQSARVVSLPMLAVLKVLAWNDRHRYTQGKDAADLRLILRSYLEAGNLDRLYAEFPHMLTEQFDFAATGGWLLGHDARVSLLKHSVRFDQVVQRLDDILASALSPDGGSALVLQLSPARPDEALKLLGAFHAGLMGKIVP